MHVQFAAARAASRDRLFVLMLALSLVATSVPLAPSIEAAGAVGDPFRFIYDQAGRLVASVTPTDTAIHTYDAVGNITGITRQAATTLAVIEFAPHAGAVGSSATIYGTAFSPTPSLNTVKFNGTTATVLSSTTTQIVTTVPAGATSGTISVKVGNTTKTTAATFAVGNTAPTITGFSPGVVDTTGSVTITGTNFETAVERPSTSLAVTDWGQKRRCCGPGKKASRSQRPGISGYSQGRVRSLVMGQSNLRTEMSETLRSLESAKFPRGGGHLPDMDSAIVDLAEIDGFVVGLVDSYLHNVQMRSDRIVLSRGLAATLTGARSNKGDEATMEPYRRRWQLLQRLSELLASTGQVRLDWVD